MFDFLLLGAAVYAGFLLADAALAAPLAKVKEGLADALGVVTPLAKSKLVEAAGAAKRGTNKAAETVAAKTSQDGV